MHISPSLSSESVQRTQARLAAGFSQHVAVALTGCLLGLILG
jgi:hypothetical protein